MHAFQLIDGNLDFIHHIQIIASSLFQSIAAITATAAIIALLAKAEDGSTRSLRSARGVVENQEEI